LVEHLNDHSNIVGLKDASTNTGYLLSILNRCGDRLDVFAASSHISLSVMMIGGKGWLAGPACITPSQSAELYRLCLAGDWHKARELQCGLWSVNQIFERCGLAACIKAALELQGCLVGNPILPLAPLDAEARKLIGKVLADIESGRLPS